MNATDQLSSREPLAVILDETYYKYSQSLHYFNIFSAFLKQAVQQKDAY
jgi:hypothetical protein